MSASTTRVEGARPVCPEGTQAQEAGVGGGERRWDPGEGEETGWGGGAGTNGLALPIL